ncbi:serine protein kinase RIO [Acidiplasma aeolicum]|jgi:RIO kinase 1|uniref:serine protein kinase RIO n=1 Tax=Acidiplasma aeolicum TaxID=507754 RepID=UPI0037104105
MSDKSALEQLIDNDEFSNRLNLDRKTYGLVFDRRTLNAVYYLIKKYSIDYVDFPISSGKESLIFKVVGMNKKSYALKIYKMSTLKFSNTMDYIKGDYRFEKERINRTNLVYIWAQKEYTNLKDMKKSGIKVPIPYGYYKNALLISYIGTRTEPAKQIKNIETDFNALYEKIKTFMRKMYNDAHLVHADLSEYNILFYRNNPYIIDVGQSVSVKHPMALEFLRRDIKNINNFFSRKNVKCDDEYLFNYITGDVND